MKYIPVTLSVKQENESAKASEDDLKKLDISKADLDKIFEKGEVHETVNNSGIK